MESAKTVCKINFYVLHNVLYNYAYNAGPNSLSQMYEDMSAELRSSRNRARPSDWLQRMESREESWKLIRQQIFEHVVSNKAIPDANVSICMIYVQLIYIYLLK